MTIEQIIRRFSRFVTNVVVAQPAAWRLFRPIFRAQWNRLAVRWDETRRVDSYDPCRAALDSLDAAPRLALDVGTGTGGGAFAIADHFPNTLVVGVDFSYEMVIRAQQKQRRGSSRRLSFCQGDGSSLPFQDSQFDLVTHNNMIPFFDETARIVMPGGRVVFAFSSGTGTPIFVPADRVRRELEQRGFTDFTQHARGRGVAFVARKT